MNLWQTLQQRLGWKLFISYLVVIVVGAVSLVIAAEWQVPTALGRHMDSMSSFIGSDMAMMADLNASFQAAVNEVLLVAAGTALVAAVLVSLFITRRIVTPIQAMQQASQRIAAGDYEERTTVVGQDELGALANSFNQMAQTLAETEKRRRQLIGDVAHELRTPLSSIKSVMEGLIDGVLPAEPATYLNVQHEVSRLQRLVHDLEELSRAEAGQILLELHPTPPALLIQTAVNRLQPQFEDKGIRLRLDIQPDLPQVVVDSGRIIQVLLNLLGNALQYTPEGGQVTVRAWANSTEVAIAVQDTGLGIAPEHLRHVFERFYRVDKSRSRVGGGSGIGLTISKYLVEAHHGRFTATSLGSGQGSTFTFILPVRRE